ncbi:MAG: cell envelope integrity EipB family protein [Pseudorhodoplanes sp.]|jgi:hypothetical protein|nr:cell envelope integrity EipB family protein [Pseudorhodoplanes sp.]
MNFSSRAVLCSATGLAAALCFGWPAAGWSQPRIELAPHRAVYDLKLSQARGNRPVESVRGRILYDFSGSRCEGYALQFRQVSEIDLGEGKTLTTDLRATTWEEGAANSFRFKSENFINQNLTDTVDGNAQRRNAGVSIALTKPGNKKFDIEPTIIFPTDHMRRIIEAALEGKTILELPVYDGSETGEKIYDTLTVIGQEIAPEKRPDDAAGRTDSLSRLKRWPVSISYFDRSKKTGEQTPVYSIKFEVYENGISRNLSLDYNDFVIAGEMTSIEIGNAKPCK